MQTGLFWRKSAFSCPVSAGTRAGRGQGPEIEYHSMTLWTKWKGDFMSDRHTIENMERYPDQIRPFIQVEIGLPHTGKKERAWGGYGGRACKRILVNKQSWFLVILVKAVYNNYRVKGMKLSRS